jgi:toxin-antitoxin system PIN domain toxin
VIIVDVNVLIFAYNEDAPQHERAREWLKRALSGSEVIGLPWAVIHGFLRITTNTRAVKPPFPMSEAVAIVEEWFTSGLVTLVEPGPRYWPILRNLLAARGVDGPLVSDAHIAALAIENDAAVCSTDRDFARFQEIRLINPLAS